MLLTATALFILRDTSRNQAAKTALIQLSGAPKIRRLIRHIWIKNKKKHSTIRNSPLTQGGIFYFFACCYLQTLFFVIKCICYTIQYKILGYFILDGDIMPFFQIKLLNTAKMPIPLAWIWKIFLFCWELCSNNRSWRFSVRQLRLSHFLILEVQMDTVKLDKRGKILIPLSKRKSYGFFTGEKFVISVSDGRTVSPRWL